MAGKNQSRVLPGNVITGSKTVDGGAVAITDTQLQRWIDNHPLQVDAARQAVGNYLAKQGEGTGSGDPFPSSDVYARVNRVGNIVIRDRATRDIIARIDDATAPGKILVLKPGQGVKKVINTQTGRVIKNPNVKQIFAGTKKAKDPVAKQVAALRASGVTGKIKFTPEGNTPYVTNSGTYMGQSGQWATWSKSDGSGTVTAFTAGGGGPSYTVYGNNPNSGF